MEFSGQRNRITVQTFIPLLMQNFNMCLHLPYMLRFSSHFLRKEMRLVKTAMLSLCMCVFFLTSEPVS
jgi:hypothetical protein